MTDMIIWPAYLDSEKTRSEGRRIPLENCVSDPSPKEIARAVKQIGYNPVVESDKKYPRSWWEPEGRVRVREVDDTKQDMLRAVAAYLQMMRED